MAGKTLEARAQTALKRMGIPEPTPAIEPGTIKKAMDFVNKGGPGSGRLPNGLPPKNVPGYSRKERETMNRQDRLRREGQIGATRIDKRQWDAMVTEAGKKFDKSDVVNKAMAFVEKAQKNPRFKTSYGYAGGGTYGYPSKAAEKRAHAEQKVFNREMRAKAARRTGQAPELTARDKMISRTGQGLEISR